MSNDVQIWKSRWDSIDQTIQEIGSGLPNKTIDRKSAFIKLVAALGTFGKKQFNFFFEGFGFENNTDQTLEKALQYPPEFVLKRLIDQVAHDIWVIETAIKQREDSSKVAALKQADLLAFRALEPVLGDGRLLAANSTVITYFQKVPAVRILPYANVALIGIPYSANLTGQIDKNSPIRDLLAIPHEVGHYVFWRGKMNGERLHILLQQQLLQAGLPQYEHWLEEIFADVYGCLIAGSVFALSAQDIQLDNMPIRLTADDRRHPAAVLRPYLSIAVLESEAGNATANTLKRAWEERIQQKGGPQQFDLKKKKTPVADGLKDVGTIVTFILNTLKKANNFQLDWSDGQPSDSSDLTPLYQGFADKLNLANSPLHVDSHPNAVNADFDEPGISNSWVHKLRDGGLVDKNNKMPAEVWLVVMNANGWGSGGQEETYPNRG
jgi:hypothetical protein